MPNILSEFLSLLKVKHTQTYANKLYSEHPYKYSLFGLSKMLTEYNIQNVGIKILNKETGINELDIPFIAHVGDEFVLVYNNDNKKISYVWQGKQIVVDVDYFNNIWSGVVLLAEPDEHSVEPHYANNRKAEWMSRMKSLLLLVIISIFFLFSCIKSEVFFNLAMALLMLSNLVGLYICTLLLMKQTYIQSAYADKICSLFKKSDCNNILESKEAKLWGVISWSEIGFGYFISNIIIILWFSNLVGYSAIINCFAMFFSFWSIWHQKVKVGQWCPLCLVVQFLFWILFLLYLAFGFLHIYSFNIEQLFIVGCIYSISVLTVSFVCSKLGLDSQIQNLIQQKNSLKMKDEVIVALLKKQTHHKVDKANSEILFGNPEAKIWVTILTNPHCEPCGLMHSRVENILGKIGNKICIQYIFSSFSEELDSSSKQLIAIYLNYSINEMTKIFHDWFTDGKYRKEDFFQRYPQNLEDSEVKKEFDNHNNWRRNVGFTATPTILVNGRILPREYRIEDISCFIEIDVNSINC